MEIKILSTFIIIVLISILYYYLINLISKNRYKFYWNILYFIWNIVLWVIIFYIWVLLLINWEKYEDIFKLQYVNLYILQYIIIIILPIILSIFKNYILLKKFNIKESLLRNVLLDILKIYWLWIIIFLILAFIINLW